MTSDVKTIFVNGVELGYQIHAAAPGLAPLVFVHGYGLRSTGPLYHSFLTELAREFTVYALDLRGHGSSAGAYENWSCEGLADDVAAFARELRLIGAVYAGHSIGGFTGLFTTLRHPGTFSKVCLLAAAPASAGRCISFQHGDIFLANEGNVEALTEVMAAAYLRGTKEQVRNAAEAAAIMKAAVHNAFFPHFINYEITDRLGEIQTPCLVINGLQDVIVPPAEQHETAVGLPLCKEVNFSCEGHMLPIEAPALTAREIIQFSRYGIEP